MNHEPAGGFLDFVPAFDDVQHEYLRKAESDRRFVNFALGLVVAILALFAIERVVFLVVMELLVLTGGNHTYFQGLDRHGAPVNEAYEIGAAASPSQDAIVSVLRTAVTEAFSSPADSSLAVDYGAYVRHVFSPVALAQLNTRKPLERGTVIAATVNQIKRLRNTNLYEISWTARKEVSYSIQVAQCVVDLTYGRLNGPPRTDASPQDYWKDNALQIGIINVAVPLGVAPDPSCNEPIPAGSAR